MLGPFVPLAAKLGRLAMELAEGRAERITLSYYGTLSGYDTRLLTRGGAERRLPGPHRAAGQLRERAGGRGRARDRGRRGASPSAVATSRNLVRVDESTALRVARHDRSATRTGTGS